MSVLKITSTNFEEEVLNYQKTVIIDFYADWCMPCKMMSPIIDNIAEENDDIKVGKINVDEAQELLDSLSTQPFANEAIIAKLFKEAEILCSFADEFRNKVTQVSKELS